MLALAFTTMTKGGNYSQQWGPAIPSIAFSKLKVSLIFISQAFLTIGTSARFGGTFITAFNPEAVAFHLWWYKWKVNLALYGLVDVRNFEMEMVSKCTSPEPFDCCPGQAIANQSTFVSESKYEPEVKGFDPSGPNVGVVSPPVKTVEVRLRRLVVEINWIGEI